MKKVKTSTGTLYKSSMPALNDLKLMPQFDIIWNLAKELSFFVEDEKKFAKEVFAANIIDYGAPTDINFIFQLREVIKCLKKGGTVLVHCLGGHGRTGMAIACIKHFLDKMPTKECLKFAMKVCKGPEEKEQIEFVKKVCDGPIE